MNETVQAFIRQKQAEQQAAKQKAQATALIEAGLYSKYYAPPSQEYVSEQFPYAEWDDASQKHRFYRVVPFKLSDEEFQQLKPYLDESNDDETTSSLYNNIGGKIKGWATAMFIIEAIISAVGGILLMALAEDEEMLIIGLVVAIVGSLVGWVSSLLLYGYGELIDKVSSIDKKLK